MTKIDMEKIILLIFFAAILFLGPGVLFDHKIKHDFPFAYSASDAFQHQVRADAIKDMGNFRYESSYISNGLEGTVGRYPPALYHLAAILSYSAGIETYDSIYFIVTFFAIIAGLVMYFIIRNFNKTVALISLPLSMLIFSFPVSIGFLWGHWPSILSQSFLVFFFWTIMRMDVKHSYLLIALALSATALTHTSETIFAFMFLALFFAIKLVAKKLSKHDIKNMIVSLVIFFVASVYYLIIFQNTWAKGQVYSFAVQPVWEGNPGFYVAGFGLLLIPMALGFIFSLPKLKNLHVSVILGLAMLISGFLNYAGFEYRAFQIRFLWPIYLSVFMGFGIYVLFKFVVKKWNFVYTSTIVIILVVLLAGAVKFPILKQTDIQVIPSMPYLNRATSQGMMDQYHWQALKWLSENTEQDSKVYFFYGDIYNQDALLRNSKRSHSQVDFNDFVKALQDRKIKQSYITELPGDSGGGITIRKGLFEFEPATESLPKEYFYGPKNICTFNYHIFDKVSRQEVLAQYNILIASKMVEKNAQVVFENNAVVILKNNNVGADCIEEGSF
ncbi:hypothetical protein CMO94_01665 [Candidatus Woesearchaeota archaeon]|jgi:hypothetical protein|nr:hypothetical protein [Candidatus Woesearchaeota archaeon]|tara:strand:- start:1430 stop:3100 length:1671 start_codon:yes stop_codon:yes gene_type:complete